MITGEMWPSRRTTLLNYLAPHLNNKLTGEEMKKAVEHLLEVELIGGTESAVTYIF